MKNFYLLFLLVLIPLLSYADAVEIDGIYYYLYSNGENSTATVTSNPDKYSGKINIPGSVTYESITYKVVNLADGAFFECYDLISVDISDGIETIGEAFNAGNKGVFYMCTKLVSVKIPNTVTYIGCAAFAKCTSLTTLNIPNSVVEIEMNAFQDCMALITIGEPNGLTSIGRYAFKGCSSLKTIMLCDNISFIGQNAFEGCKSLSSVVLPKSLKSISRFLFYGCSGLLEVSFPSSITQIEDYAFQNCSSLKTINIPDHVDMIDIGTFWGCSNLKSISIPANVKTVYGYAFAGCSNLSSVTIGSGVKIIYEYAFASCFKISDVFCLAENAPSVYSNAFENSNLSSITLHVPAGCMDAYKAVAPWSGFKEIVSIAETKYNLTYIVDGEVYKTYQLKEGETITPEPAPSKENSVFSGWSEIPETMPAHNVEITGSFSSLSNYDDIKIGTSGINSFSSVYDLDFTDVEGLKAYIAAGYNDDSKTVWLMRVYQVPANTGLLVKGTSGNIYHVPHKPTHSYYSNMLIANTGEEITIGETDGDMTNYYLKNGMLLSVNESAKIGKNKCYLQVPTKVFARTRSIGYVFGDDGATALPQNIIQPEQTNDVYYNLQGQRVENPGKGLYIHNGKKVVIK